MFGFGNNENTVKVTYTGILPDLFREGQGVVTEGKFIADSDVFVADKMRLISIAHSDECLNVICF